MASTQTPDLHEITEDSTKSTGGPWRVVLWDDNEHTYEYVIEMLMEICTMTVEKAFLHAVQVDQEKRTVVFSGEFEHAEHVQERILTYGADPRMSNSKGSMSATLER
ncbi:ATP-dependent Clp protease adaptor ClpS [Leptospira weilii]|uniref:ATP-dependent Clp protease adaptor ClpS n=1 Tax=Leptospira weilii TaxID=28184 RepID=UPI00056D1F50|nr:ATP-dependent Clp protease adaptor ClpS [Leptospira weilii]